MLQTATLRDLGSFMWSLVGLEEGRVRHAICASLHADFVIKQDVPGLHILEGSRVVADLTLEARPHIASQGFPAQLIPVEVKQLNDKDNKSVKAAWQAITYAQSTFNGQRPPFVLLFPPLSLFLKNGQFCEHATCLRSLLPKANVGELSFRRNGEWEVTFAPHRFFSPSTGLGKNAHVASKRYVGTWK